MKYPFIITIAILFISCTKKESEKAQIQNTIPQGESVLLTESQYKAAGIELGKIQDRVLSGSVSATGLLDVPPQNLVNITAPFGGFLRSTPLLQGMKVVKGQSIAVIENPEYIQLQQDFLESKSQLAFLEAEHQRQVELARENVNAQKTLQKSLAELNAMKAKNSGLRSKLSMLNISADHLEAGTIRSTIELRTPISGYVTQVNASIGAFVNPTDLLFRIVDTQHLHAELIVFERELHRIKIGQKIRFTLSNETKERTAKIYLIGREISSDRTIRVHGHLDQEDVELIPGMYLKATIETGGKSVPSLPEQAVLIFEDTRYIIVREGQEFMFKLVPIIVGLSENGFVEVHALQDEDLPGKEVVVKGGHKLLSKMKNEQIDEH